MRFKLLCILKELTFLTVYGSSNIESKLQTKLHEGSLYSVSFCDSGSPILEGFELDKESTVQQVFGLS